MPPPVRAPMKLNKNLCFVLYRAFSSFLSKLYSYPLFLSSIYFLISNSHIVVAIILANIATKIVENHHLPLLRSLSISSIISSVKKRDLSTLEPAQQAELYQTSLNLSTIAAASSGIISSWWPVKLNPLPPSSVGRCTTLVAGR